MKNKFIKINGLLSNNEKKTMLYESENSNTAVLNIEPGDQVQPHYHPNADDVWVVFQGKGEYLAGKGQTFPMEAGMVIPNLKGEVHGIKNTSNEPLVVIAVSSPVPVQAIFVD